MLFGIAIAYILIGLIAGLLAGLLGIGGGVVTVPALYFLFNCLGYPQATNMHMAIGTSLAAMILNTISSTWAHHRRKAVKWDLVKKMLPGLIAGSLVGALCASYLSGVILEIFFGFFLCAVGSFFLKKTKPHMDPHQIPPPFFLNLISAGIGCLSNILGIGGGIITVPTFISFKLPEKVAIATSSAVSFFITSMGTLSYLSLGLGKLSTLDTIGYVNLPAFAVIGVTTFFAAPYGAKLAHQTNNQTLRKVFGVVLLLAGLSMLI